jgi:hypothetical protein
MPARTALAALVALSIGLAISFLVARRQQASGDPEWRRARAQLSAPEKRAVAVAVRQGRQVEDPRLRPAASAMARDMVTRLARFERPSRLWRVLWVLLAVATLLAVVGIVFDDSPWPHVLTIVMNVVLAGGWWLARRMMGVLSGRAQAALIANEA